jgi:pimeloyl-ACP methyl ester carboxylesterase
MDHTAGVRPASIVKLMVGEKDEVVRPEYSHEYAAALQAQGGDAHVTILPSLGHNILQRPAVLGMTDELIAKLKVID